MPTQLAPPPEFRGIFRQDDDARAVYSEAAGIARAIPVAVAVPMDADDVPALVRWARSTRIPLIPRGSGSSMAGGAIGRGVIVDLSRLSTIGPVDTDKRRVTVGPGALRAAVDSHARDHGLRFPVDPSSGAFCTMGGMASTNAAGARSLKFGATRNWITALDCVFEDGSRTLLRRGAELPTQVKAPALATFLRFAMPTIFTSVLAEPIAEVRHHGVLKESSGYALTEFAYSGDLVDILIGSEGTLAIIVGLELALAPVPNATSSLLAAFPTLEMAIEGAIRARDAGATACELLDRTFLELAAPAIASSARGAPPLPTGTEAVLLAEVEGNDSESAGASASALERAFTDAGASLVTLALDLPSETALWELRHAVSPMLSRLAPALRSMQFIEDAAVPPAHLPEYVRRVRHALASRGIAGVIFGHAGDAHVHVNPLVDTSRLDWRAEVEAILDEITEAVAELGGTLAGEHGDGRLRTPLLGRVWKDDALVLFELVKRSFDPLGIFNPGVKVPLPTQEALTEIKYDPSLPPLPRVAAAALARVERERAYATFRLDLLDAETNRLPAAASPL